MGERVWAAIDRFYASQEQVPGPRKRKKKSDKRSEHDEQRDICQLLRTMGIVFTSIPNGGYKLSPYAAGKLKAGGLQKGFPDLILLSRVPKGDYRGVALEIKRSKESGRSRVRPEQKEWLDRLANECGWYAKVCYGIEDVRDVLEELGWVVERKSAA